MRSGDDAPDAALVAFGLFLLVTCNVLASLSSGLDAVAALKPTMAVSQDSFMFTVGKLGAYPCRLPQSPSLTRTGHAADAGMAVSVSRASLARPKLNL